MSERSNFLIKHFGLRGIPVFEAGKGLLALAGGVVLLFIRHSDFTRMIRRFLEFAHVNPDRKFYQMLMRGAGHIDAHLIVLFFFGLLLYMAVRFIEAVGLWLEKEWAEWFAVLSGAMYMPWEIRELLRHATPFYWTIFAINVLIVVYLVWLLFMTYKHKREVAKAMIFTAGDAESAGGAGKNP